MMQIEYITYGITNKFMSMKSFGRYDRLSGVMTAKCNEVSERINKKTSTKLHLPKKSSHKNIDSLLRTETKLGGMDHSANSVNCFVYGHNPEKLKR